MSEDPGQEAHYKFVYNSLVTSALAARPSPGEDGLRTGQDSFSATGSFPSICESMATQTGQGSLGELYKQVNCDCEEIRVSLMKWAD